MRERVHSSDKPALYAALARARSARLNLPGRVARAAELAEVRVPVPDRPGVLAEITTLASELGVNIHDVEMMHSSEGDSGVVVLLVDAGLAERFTGGLVARGYRPSTRSLE
jgi:prephenate dehydrogenase